jgi:hypothetical protein
MTGSPDVTVDGGQGSSLMRYTCASSNASMTELPLTASAERLQRLVEEEQQEELKLRCTTSRAADGEFTAWGCLIRRERFGFLLVLALAAVNQANGASSVLNYSTTLLMSSLFEVPVELAVTLSLLLLSTKLLGVIASLLLAGRCGRRMLVLAGALLTADSLGAVRLWNPRDGTMRALTPRKRASAALKTEDSRAQAALGALRDGLYHHYWLARWRAIQVLQETAPKNDDAAIVELLRLCQDPTPEVRVAAPEALEKIASRGHLDVERALEQLCADEFACVSAAAAVHAAGSAA